MEILKLIVYNLFVIVFILLGLYVVYISYVARTFITLIYKGNIMTNTTLPPTTPIEPIAIKNPLSSKTLWFNMLMLVFSMVEMITPILQPYLPVSAFAAITATMAIVNIVLRFISTARLMWNPPSQ